MNTKRWKYARMDLTAGAIMLLAGVGFYWMGVGPMMEVRHQQQTLREQVRQQQSSVAEAQAKVQEMRGELDRARQALAGSPVQLQPGSHVNSRLGKLTELAVKFELKVDEIQPAETAYGPDYGYVPIRLTGRGTYKTWTTFLHELTRSFADMSVDSFQLSAKPNAPAEFHVSLRWYVSPNSIAAK